MNKGLMIFDGREVEVFEWNDKVLFNAKNVGDCLDIKNVNDNISKMNEKQVIKLKNSDIGKAEFRKLNNAGENFLTESGVYKLIFKSKKEEAEKFQDWVTDEVLPSVRKTGSYKIHNDEEKQTELQQIATNVFGELNTKIDNSLDDLSQYYRPTHKNKLNFNKFIKGCLLDNATKENCKLAKETFLTLLGGYSIYEEVPIEVLKDKNTIPKLYDICKNINNSIVGGIQ